MRILKRHKAPLPAVPGRTPGWEHRLVAVLAEYDAAPFEWGRRDCITLAADTCAALTGVDPLVRIRGYASEEEAMAILEARGCGGIADALAQAFPEVAPALARRGDCGVFVHPALGAATVVKAGAYAVGRHARGSFKVPSTRIVRAFRVGW